MVEKSEKFQQQQSNFSCFYFTDIWVRNKNVLFKYRRDKENISLVTILTRKNVKKN